MVIQRLRGSLRQQSTPPWDCAGKYQGFGRAVAVAGGFDGLPWPPGPCLSKQLVHPEAGSSAGKSLSCVIWLGAEFHLLSLYSRGDLG